MLFIAGISQMSREEKIALLAQMNCLTGLNVLSEGFQKGAHKVKKVLIGGTSWLAGRAGLSGLQCRINEINTKTDWNTDVLRNKIATEIEVLSELDQSEISRRLRQQIIQIAQIDNKDNETVIATAIIHRAAKALKIDVRLYTDILSLENKVFEECIREQIENIKKNLAIMSDVELNDFEDILNQELGKLSQAEKEAIRKATGLEELSSRAIIIFLKTTSTAALAQLFISGFGFGAFLFITTSLKALSLLLGMTFSFGIYTAATSTLAFLLSGPFMLIIAALSGGIILRKTSVTLADQISKILVLTGRSKILLTVV
jgi:hypothetical protein